MSAWGSVPKAKPQSISDIITQQAEDAGDDDLQAALRASLADGPPDDDALREALDASTLRAPPPTTDDDASLALALALADEEEKASFARWGASERRKRAAAARHEKVRLGYDDDEACRPPPAAAEEVRDDVLGDALAAEGVELADGADRVASSRGLIGRRADGSLVSKHDGRLDELLKARTLEAEIDGAGDLRSSRVPARCYHDLVAFQRKADAGGRRGGDAAPRRTPPKGRPDGVAAAADAVLGALRGRGACAVASLSRARLVREGDERSFWVCAGAGETSGAGDGAGDGAEGDGADDDDDGADDDDDDDDGADDDDDGASAAPPGADDASSAAPPSEASADAPLASFARGVGFDVAARRAMPHRFLAVTAFHGRSRPGDDRRWAGQSRRTHLNGAEAAERELRNLLRAHRRARGVAPAPVLARGPVLVTAFVGAAPERPAPRLADVRHLPAARWEAAYASAARALRRLFGDARLAHGALGGGYAALLAPGDAVVFVDLQGAVADPEDAAGDAAALAAFFASRGVARADAAALAAYAEGRAASLF